MLEQISQWSHWPLTSTLCPVPLPSSIKNFELPSSGIIAFGQFLVQISPPSERTGRQVPVYPVRCKFTTVAKAFVFQVSILKNTAGPVYVSKDNYLDTQKARITSSFNRNSKQPLAAGLGSTHHSDGRERRVRRQRSDDCIESDLQHKWCGATQPKGVRHSTSCVCAGRPHVPVVIMHVTR